MNNKHKASKKQRKADAHAETTAQYKQ